MNKKEGNNRLKEKTVFITGASRGIGKAIALRVAREGANVVVAAKTVKPHRVLSGTIHDTVSDIEALGSHAIACPLDIRDEQQIATAMAKAVEHFGGIDVLVNNASAINLTGTLETPMKRYDLMFSVNVRGTFATSQAAIPYLLEAENPHILFLETLEIRILEKKAGVLSLDVPLRISILDKSAASLTGSSPMVQVAPALRKLISGLLTRSRGHLMRALLPIVEFRVIKRRNNNP